MSESKESFFFVLNWKICPGLQSGIKKYETNHHHHTSNSRSNSELKEQ